MNLPSVNKSLFHQVILYFVPGTIVTIPLLLVINALFSGFNIIEFYANYTFEFYLISMVVIFAAGIILDGIGSYIEDYLDDICKIKKSAWYGYLFDKCGPDNLTVFHKYLDGAVFRYKMKLSLIPALFILLFEFCYISHLYQGIISDRMFSCIFIFIVLSILYLYKDAKDTCESLDEQRKKYLRNKRKSSKSRK